MPIKWVVKEVPYKDGMLTDGEPFGFLSDDAGDSFILTRQQVEVPADPSKATEVIGTLAEMPQDE